MTILRFSASADNTITNAFQSNLSVRGTGSNMGQSDILEVFSIYAQQSVDSSEKSRILIQFPVTDISAKRSSGIIPASGEVNFILKMYNAPHFSSTPKDYKLIVAPLSKAWEEGYGLDMEEYSDLTYNKEGSNWLRASEAEAWSVAGGDFISSDAVTASFSSGLEDLSIDVTSIVEKWILTGGGGGYNNYGLAVYLDGDYENSTSRSYYTKKFFARSSEFFYKRPIIEARWDSTTKDDRANFYLSSSLMSEAQNKNKIYLYNRPRGVLTNIPMLHTDGHSNKLKVDLYPALGSASLATFTGSYVSTGVYSASVFIDGDYNILYDVWSTGSTDFFTGSISPKTHSGETYGLDSKYVVSIRNLNEKYSRQQTARFRLYSRLKNWSPNIHTVAKNDPENLIIENALFKAYRIVDGAEVVSYSTGAMKYSQLSYDVSGNYFDLDMSLFQTGYQYGLKFSFYNDYLSSYVEQPYIFKFRVVD